MTQLKKLPLWLWMLTKRLYKKPAFLVLLLLIPVLAIGYRSAVRDSGNVLTVGLAQQAQDPVSIRIFQELMTDGHLVHYEIFSSPEEAREHLQAGKVDAVWLFPGDMQQHIDAFAENPSKSNGFITVLERTDNVALALSREKLSSVVYGEAARVIYLNYLRAEVPELSHLSDAELMQYYDNTVFSADLFHFGDSEKAEKDTNFLLSPLRGLLGVIIVLCGLATAMHFQQDDSKGTFSRVSPQWRIVPETACHLVAVVQLTILSSICLGVCGLAQGFWIELAALVLYSLCVAAFSMMLRQLLGSIRLMAAVLPVLCVLMLVLCPVFFDLGALRKIQYLLPPTYYINAVHNPAYLGYMALYTAACFILRWIAAKLRKV